MQKCQGDTKAPRRFNRTTEIQKRHGTKMPRNKQPQWSCCFAAIDNKKDTTWIVSRIQQYLRKVTLTAQQQDG